MRRKAPFEGLTMAEAVENVEINLGRKIPEPQTLPPFSGDEPTCAKCGCVGAFTKFMGYGECQHGTGGVVIGVWPNGRLHRSCHRCDYEWDEATVE